jgi:hypothetical protein
VIKLGAFRPATPGGQGLEMAFFLKSSCFTLHTTLKALALVGVGFAAGVFFRGTGLPQAIRQFGVCASAKQFLVEFRLWDGMTLGLMGMPPLDRGDVMLEVDSKLIGVLSTSRHPVRRFLCEDNHVMRIAFSEDQLEPKGQKVDHTVEFTVSRPSVFYVTERGPVDFSTCVSVPWCPVTLDLELSHEDPDQKRQSTAANRE